MKLLIRDREILSSALNKGGYRPTPQREHIYLIILNKRDHPTADEIYVRCKKEMQGISLATVYNCLEMFVECGLVKQVNFEREPSRYCPNLMEHAHFHCKNTGKVFDIDLPNEYFNEIKKLLPNSFNTDIVEINFRGICKTEMDETSQLVNE